jgi:hypothetical protein
VLFFQLVWIIVVESADRCGGCAGLAGNYQSKVLFEKGGKPGETTVLQNRMHPSQQKFFDLLGTHCRSFDPIFPLFIRPETAPEMPPTRAFSRQLVAYVACFLPVATYIKANDSRIAGVCDDQYTATLQRLEETGDDAFKLYMTRKTQAWFRRWGCLQTSDAAASPAPGAAPGAAPGGAGVSTPAKDTAPEPSDDEGGAELITPEHGDLASSSPPAGLA